MGTGGIGNGLKTLNRKELMTRAKALDADERFIVAKCIDTDTLQLALRRRDEFTSDILREVAKVMDTLGAEPTIQAKEAAIKELKAILRIPEVRIQ